MLVSVARLLLIQEQTSAYLIESPNIGFINQLDEGVALSWDWHAHFSWNHLVTCLLHGVQSETYCKYLNQFFLLLHYFLKIDKKINENQKRDKFRFKKIE